MTNKEKEKLPPSPPRKEKLIRPAQPEFQPPPEVKDWLTQLEKGQSTPPPVTDNWGQIILSSPEEKPVKIKLPLTPEEVAVNLKQKVNTAIRWLAEWCYRLIRMNPQKVVFQK